MKMNEIINAIKMLAQSQGYYGRLLEAIMDLDEYNFECLKTELESQNFEDTLDMVLYFEC